MTPRKIDRAFRLAKITMPAVREHILRQLEPQRAALQDITSAQLAAVLMLAKAIYHEGRASTGSECVDGDSVWVGAGVDKLLPLEALRKIEIIHTTEPIPAHRHSGRDWPASQWSITNYKMDYSERV